MIENKNDIKSVCVYCASSDSVDPVYFDAAHALGRQIAVSGMSLVYGAGSHGLMGALSDGVKECGGKVIGVIPRFMVERGWARPDLDEMIQVESMHERKDVMCSIGDAAIALPGGVGTLDEFMDSLSLKKLGLYTKPMVLLNTNGFFDPLSDFLDNCVRERFMRLEHGQMYQVAETPEMAIEMILTQRPWDASMIESAVI